MRTIILHYHLFKNAGTSVDRILQDNFGDRWVTAEFPGRPGPQGNTPQVADWIRNTPDAVAFSSHTAQGPLPQIEGVRIISFLLLRNPVRRIRSAYQFERTQQAETFGSVLARHTSLEGYVRVRQALPHDRQCRNFQTARLAAFLPGPEPELARATAALDALTVTGSVERFSAAIAQLAETISSDFPEFQWAATRQNVSERTASADDVMIDALLHETNTDDLSLLEALSARTAAGRDAPAELTRDRG